MNPSTSKIEPQQSILPRKTLAGGSIKKVLRIVIATLSLMLLGRLHTAFAAPTLTTLHTFTGSPDGADPEAGLVEGNDGNFYGTTADGGTDGHGTVFRISTAGALSVLYSFTGGADGGTPDAALAVGSEGNFYGITANGGTDGHGTVFKISPAGALATLHTFTGSPDGADPGSGLVEGSDSNFYSTTANGGTDGDGTVFKISPSGALTVLYSFTGGPDGGNPKGALMEGSDGNFYGTTDLGTNTSCNGESGCGTVFKISPAGALTTLYRFTERADGANPESGLVEGSDSNFYGTAAFGGTSTSCNGGSGCGTVFKITPTGILTTLHSFTGGTDGSTPMAGLVQGSDSNFYGTTSQAGINGGGTAFKISPAGALTTLYSFAGDGAFFLIAKGSPQALVQGGDGNFYGTSSGFGTDGIVFKLDVGCDGGCAYMLSATNVTLAAKGGSESVSVRTCSARCSWTAVSNDPFITITSGTNGAGNGTVRYTVPGNTNATPLVGTMTIAGQTFTINQDPGGCTYSLSPKIGKVRASGGSSTVRVTPNLSDCEWMAVSDDGFITISAGASGAGNGTVGYTVTTNTETEARIGTMEIASEIFTVSQAAAACEFSLGGTTASFSSTGGSSSVTVTANGTNCAWKAAISGTFIQITAGASGTGNGTIDYTVEANTRTATRKGTITVGKEKLTITQSGAP
jgi:uncharacterized repeat protein (TIGR03803 family)